VFLATVKEVADKDIALPVAPPLEAVWLEDKPCKLLVLPVKAPVTLAKTAPDCTSPTKDNTRVVLAGTM